MVNLLLKRIAKKPMYTIGKLYIDDKYFCDTIEDTDRGLSQALPLDINAMRKVKGKTAIPTGTYKITLDVVSQRFGNRAQYKFCNGKLPRLLNVPAFEGVLIHIGNDANDTEGCILVGKNKQVGKVLDSTITFRKLYEILKVHKDITITIK